MATLSELLPIEAIRLDVTVDDWKEAVRAAGGLMTETGAATDAYTGEMLENVEENGPYIVIAPGLAFAHARPSPAVLSTGMSWVRLARPVDFGHETNDPVDLVVGLAAKDKGEHQAGMAALAKLLADPRTAQALKEAPDAASVHALLSPEAEAAPPEPRGATQEGGGKKSAPHGMHKILTVCGNGVGTSLFLKNTLEKVLDRWGWTPYVTVEATDTISAKGKASEAVAILTSREIARTLGDVGVPVQVIEDFTSTPEVDRTLRRTYDV